LNLFAETLAGIAVFTRLGEHGKGILLKTETEYIKKAKGIQIMDVTYYRESGRICCF
jgi:hypothetical protein